MISYGDTCHFFALRRTFFFFSSAADWKITSFYRCNLKFYQKALMELQMFFCTFLYLVPFLFSVKICWSKDSFLSWPELVMLERSAELFEWLSSLVRCQKVKGKPLKSVRDLNYALRDRRGKTAGNEKRERRRATPRENSLNYLRREHRQYDYAYVED